MEPRTSSRAGSSRTRGAPSTEGAAEEFSDAGVERTTHTQRPAGLVNKMKERATTQLTTQKNRATDGIGTLAQAVRHTTERLRDEEHGTIAQYVERAADQLERFSGNLRQKDVNELLQDAQRLARRQPALFIGGSFAVGLLAARFLKSSRGDDVAADVWDEPRTTANRQASDLPGAY